MDVPIVFAERHYLADFASTSGQGDGLQNGWQTWYTGSGYLSDPQGPSPVGESFHLTSLSGASVSLSFFGALAAVLLPNVLPDSTSYITLKELAFLYMGLPIAPRMM